MKEIVKKLWSKLSLKLQISICVFLGGFIIFFLGQMILPIFTVLGFVFSLLGGGAAFLGIVFLISEWMQWSERN